MVETKGTKRIDNACIPCQRRKTRCDGVTPACASCTRQNIACSYTERRRRGPGKSKKYIENLEERLKSLESALQSKAPQPSESSQAQPNNTQSSSQASHNHASVLEIPSAGSLEEIPNGLGHVSPVPSGASSPSQTGSLNEIQPTPPTLGMTAGATEPVSVEDEMSLPPNDLPVGLHHFFMLTSISGSPSIVDFLHSQLTNSGFERKSFISLNFQSLLIPFIQNALDDITQFYPLYTSQSFAALFQEVVDAENAHPSPAQLAITNALIAVIIQWKVDNGANQAILPLAWGYFKNAFSIFPELMARGDDIYACQGLLSMAIFLRGTVDARTAANLAATTARSVQSIGFHKSAWYQSLDPITAEQYKRVFCMSYVVDCDESIKQGLPSTFGLEIIDVEPPLNNPPDGVGNYSIPGTQTTINFLHYLARLTEIQSRAFNELYIRNTTNSDATIMQNKIAEFNHQLDVWRMDLPVEIRPNLIGTLEISEPEMPIIYLTVLYYTTTSIINSAIKQYEPMNPLEAIDQDLSVIAARASLQIVNGLPLHPFALTWKILYHAMYAVITLFSAILERPLSSATQANIQAIAQFARGVEHLIMNHGCDLHKLLRGCKRIYQVAHIVIMSHGQSPSVQPPWLSAYLAKHKIEDFTSIASEMPGGIQKIRIVQGLMGNIPSLCCKATNLFANVFNIEPDQNRKYGLFAPESLFPEKFNFTFS